MGRKRIDWESLRTDYMQNHYASLKEFAAAHDMQYGSVRNHCAGWAEEKARYKGNMTDLAVAVSLEEDVMTTAQRNLRHVALWDRFTATVEEAFEDYGTLHYGDGSIKVAAVERLANVMEKVQKGQRLALGMDKETKDAKGLLSEISAAIGAAQADYGGGNDDVEKVH